MNTALPTPSVLGLRASFGFGDRLGLATPGHIEACRGSRFFPIFAQQSIREMTRTERTPADVMTAAQKSIQSKGWVGPWGADADHLKSEQDVCELAKAGFTFFTIDPSAYVQNQADTLTGNDLQKEALAVVDFGAFESLAQVSSLYLQKSFEIPGAGSLVFETEEPLLRAVVKYGKAIAHAEKMAGWINRAAPTGQAEIEISVDETDTPTSTLEHLFIAQELRRRAINVVSLAPRFIGEFEKGIDYKGDLKKFEETLRVHLGIALLSGPYKISVHSGSDKFKIYPILGRVCGDLLHVKTAGTSYLEALRVVARQAPQLFLEIIQYSMGRFDTDKATYHISADLARIPNPSGLTPTERENVFLNEDGGRQVLHVTFGSVLTMGKGSTGQVFKEGIINTLITHAGLHEEILAKHFGKHLRLLEGREG